MKSSNDWIYSVSKNIHGAWVIYGIAGIRQYYDYTKKEAIKMYKEYCTKNILSFVE